LFISHQQQGTTAPAGSSDIFFHQEINQAIENFKKKKNLAPN